MDTVLRFAGETFPEPRALDLPVGEAWLYTAASPERGDAPNEDALAVAESSTGVLLAVADGVGGRRGGHRASSVVVDAIAHALEYPTPAPERRVVDAIHRANLELTQDPDAGATTVAVVELTGDRIRCYHVGDSTMVVSGQRGRIKLRTVDHSPVGYLLAAGNITEEEAILHAERHYVSNAVGDLAMQVEVGPDVGLALRDTLVLGTDGLFDNLRMHEIVDIIRKGPLEKAAKNLARRCRERMVRPEPRAPSKPDDLTFILYRRRTAKAPARPRRPKSAP
ncbi:MAG: protein phosphatase 2C domain-containing protein [Myxococcota bacterium]